MPVVLEIVHRNDSGALSGKDSGQRLMNLLELLLELIEQMIVLLGQSLRRFTECKESR